MVNNFIKYAANHYYKENIEGEPLDQEVPIECFIAGVNFILKAQKIRGTNCNISNYSSYNLKKNAMEDIEKFGTILNNVEKIMKIKGFYITANGDPSVGINPATWELRNDFYFDNQEELEEFRKELKSFFEFYCGEVTDVLTFEEEQQMIDEEIREQYRQHNTRYLIRKDNMYKKTNSTASYSSSVGDAIHFELPSWMNYKEYCDSEIIESTSREFKKILLDAAGKLESEINNHEYLLRNAKRNLKLINDELKYGQQ